MQPGVDRYEPAPRRLSGVCGHTLAASRARHHRRRVAVGAQRARRPRRDPRRPIAPVGNDSHRPLFWAIDRHGSPQSAYPLSVRSITTIVATRLAATARPDDKPSTLHGRHEADRGPVSKWDAADHARALAQRKAATDRLASYEKLLENADAYAEAILQRLDTELSR